MSWTQAFLAAAMTRNSDGSEKSEPFFWHPKNGKLSIPPDPQDHGRPILSIEGDNPEDTFILILHADRLEGQFRGQRQVLARLE